MAPRRHHCSSGTSRPLFSSSNFACEIGAGEQAAATLAGFPQREPAHKLFLNIAARARALRANNPSRLPPSTTCRWVTWSSSLEWDRFTLTAAPIFMTTVGGSLLAPPHSPSWVSMGSGWLRLSFVMPPLRLHANGERDRRMSLACTCGAQIKRCGRCVTLSHRSGCDPRYCSTPAQLRCACRTLLVWMDTLAPEDCRCCQS
eukprot:scaffold295425_cov32-Tisochrysis_lutea.AAC.2